jgi:hypothetical protein
MISDACDIASVLDDENAALRASLLQRSSRLPEQVKQSGDGISHHQDGYEIVHDGAVD